MNIKIKPIKRVVIYFGKNEEWYNKNNVIALVDTQIRFPYGTLTTLRGFKLVRKSNSNVVLEFPRIYISDTNSVFLFGGKEFKELLEAAIIGTYNKIYNEAKPGETWEKSKTDGVVYLGIARKDYNDKKYRSIK